MFRILIVDQNVIDCKVMKTILSEKLKDQISVSTETMFEKATRTIEATPYDLLLVNVPFHTTQAKEFVRKAYRIRSNMCVILMSSKPETEIAQLSGRLHVNHYLLKPFSPEKLLEAVEYEQKELKNAANDSTVDRIVEYMDQISSCLQKCQYKECVKVAKEYIDDIYQNTESKSLLREKVIDFANALMEIDLGQNNQIKVRLEHLRTLLTGRIDYPENQFMVLTTINEMLSLMFEEMDRGGMYQDDVMKKALNYVDRNITRKISLENVSEYINLSPTYFSKLFKKKTGVNFITYVTDGKLEYAKRMLIHTDVPVMNIAHELAYNETNYFCKAFKKKHGVTPTEYRETHMVH